MQPARIGAALAWVALVLAARCAIAAPAASAAAAPPAIEVTDDAGSTIRLAQPAVRVVSLAPSITEQLFAIGVGERIVGTSVYSDFPPQASRIPVVAAAGGIDLERIASLHPDLVITWGSGYGSAALEGLRKLAVPVYVSEPASLESIASSLERLGRLTAAPGAAAQAQHFRSSVQALRQRFGGRAPVRAFYQIWAQPLMTVSGHQVLGEALALCGAHNIFADLTALAPTVSAEAVIAADPQIILTDEPGGVDHGALDGWKRYPHLSAVTGHQLYTLNADRMARPGPRMLQELAVLCERVEAARHAAGAD